MENNTVHDAWLDLFKVRRDDVLDLLKDMHRNVGSPNSTNKLDVDLDDWTRATNMVMDGLKLIEAEVLIAKQTQLKERE